MKVITKDGIIENLSGNNALLTLRHTAAHILAQAVSRLYPEASFAYGPANEKGFYYDVDLKGKKISESDLPAIENEMRAIIKENLPLKPFILSRDEAVALMRERNEPSRSSTLPTLTKTKA